MPSKKKKYNSRFPPARIKRIMQADEEVGKVAAVVPVIISRTLEIFVESLLRKASDVTKSRNARTLTPAHLKASINSENQFRFLREMVATIPDIQPVNEDEASESQPINSISVPNTRGSKRVVSRCPPTSKVKGGQRKTGSSRPRIVTQEESADEDDDIEDTDEEEEGEPSVVDGVGGGGDHEVSQDRVMESCYRPVSTAVSIMDTVSLPVVDDDYDNV